jgi:hypothetical protein
LFFGDLFLSLCFYGYSSTRFFGFLRHEFSLWLSSLFFEVLSTLHFTIALLFPVHGNF